MSALCIDSGKRLAVVAAGQHNPRDLKGLTASATGLPASVIDAICIRDLPTLPSGKPDYQAARSLAVAPDTGTQHGTELRRLFAEVLQLDVADIDRDTCIVDLGGNSLSYVSMSVRLERALGRLPVDWQRLPLRELEATPKPPNRWWRSWAARWKPLWPCVQRRSCSSSARTPTCSSCGAARTYCWASPDTTSAASA